MTKEVERRHTHDTLYLTIEYRTTKVYSIGHVLNLQVLITDVGFEVLHELFHHLLVGINYFGSFQAIFSLRSFRFCFLSILCVVGQGIF